MNVLQFLSANESLLVTTLRESAAYPQIKPQTQAKACRTLVASLDEEAQLALAVSMGYDPDAVDVPVVVEDVVLPSDVKILTHVNAKEGTSKYAQLRFIRMSGKGAYAVCEYGNTEIYAAIGTSVANRYFLARKLSNNPVLAGELIHVTMEQGTLRRETEGAMKTLWVSKIHTSSMPECQAILSTMEGALTRTDLITLAQAKGNTYQKAVEIVAAESAADAQEAIRAAKALAAKSDPLLSLLGKM